jgi:hypothetical protein
MYFYNRDGVGTVRTDYISIVKYSLNITFGRAMAQVRTSWPHTTEARFPSRVSLCETCGEQSTNGTDFGVVPVSIISLRLHTHLLLLADNCSRSSV